MSALLDLLRITPLRQIAQPLWYPGYQPGMPDLLVLRMPPALHAVDAAGILATIRVIFCETHGDRVFLEKCLDRPIDIVGGEIDFARGFDKPNYLPSELPYGADMGLLLYPPPETGWPHLVVTTLDQPDKTLGLARDRYGYDAFADEAGALDHMAKLASGVLKHAPIELRGPGSFRKN